jgi:hypothetical protein
MGVRFLMSEVTLVPVLFSEALLAHDVYRRFERPSGALPPEGGGHVPTWQPSL